MSKPNRSTTQPDNGHKPRHRVTVQPLGNNWLVTPDNVGEPLPVPGNYVKPWVLTQGMMDEGHTTPAILEALTDWQPTGPHRTRRQRTRSTDPFLRRRRRRRAARLAGRMGTRRRRADMATDRTGRYLLLVGLAGSGKSRLAQELGAREREAGGRSLAIVAEAANSWRTRNRQLPAGARVDIVAGVPDLTGLAAALEGRHAAGKQWPTLIIVDPATLVTAEWGDGRRDAATYDYPTVSRSVAALEAATVSPEGNRPKLVWCVHTPETEAGGRNRRAVGGYTQAAGVAYLLPEAGRVTVLKAPRDCPQDPPAVPMLYSLTDGRIVYAGLGTGTGEKRNKRDRKTDRRRITNKVDEAGEYGITPNPTNSATPRNWTGNRRFGTPRPNSGRQDHRAG